LTLVWSAFANDRLGEVAYLQDHGPWSLGRDAVGRDALVFSPPPPHATRRRALGARAVSRDQLRIAAHDEGILVENRGRAAMRVNGGAEVRAPVVVREGDVVEIENVLSLLYEPRALEAPHATVPYPSKHALGRADPCGIVGESDRVQQLRAEMAMAAAASFHVLVQGETGSGKELVAEGIHALSARARGPFVACNVSAIPHTLVASELFGHERNYPNAGMPERVGLLGTAENGTLFLDEIGEVPADVHAMLLRALDKRGEYHRLGSAVVRSANVRFVAATNRALASLKSDFVPRFRIKIGVPALNDRRADVPLIARELVLQLASDAPELAARFVAGADVRFSQPLMTTLVRHSYTANVRELDELLWRSVSASRGDELADIEKAPAAVRDAATLAADEMRALLDAHRWNASRAAASIAMHRSSFVRRMKQLGVERK